jgi:hypothetical protein
MFGRLWACTVAVMAVALAGANYDARLYFQNANTGESNPGALHAAPGEVVEIWFDFHQVDQNRPNKWGTLQVTLSLEGLTLMGAADAANWSDKIRAAESFGGPPEDFLVTILHDSDNGILYDYAIDPTDASHAKVADVGLYCLLGVIGTQPRSHSWMAKLFQFTVQAGSEGQELWWAMDGRVTGTGLSTRILDQTTKAVDITDNYVQVVPEPAASIAILASWAVLRRKRHA